MSAGRETRSVTGMPLVVDGARGRVASALRAAWDRDPPAGLRPLWQSRTPRSREWLGWGDLPEGVGGGVLVHLAGATPTGGGDPDGAAALALGALERARRAGIAHVFLASSAAVYGRPASTAPLAEDAAPAPETAYGAGKRAMEAEARRWRDATPGAPGITCLRIGNVAGTDALAAGVEAARPAAPLILDRFPDGAMPRRSYVGPATLAALLAALARRAGAGTGLPQVLNLAAPGEGVEMGALVEALAAEGRVVPVRHRPAPQTALRALILDTARLQALVDMPDGSGTAAAIAAEWQAFARPRC